MKNKSSNKSEMRIKEFLDKRAMSNPTDCFSALDISTQVYNQPYSGNTYVSSSIKNLLLKGGAKIVSFGNNGRPYPMYQSIKGSLSPIEVIDEDSEEFNKMNLISVSAFCRENKLLSKIASMLLQELKDMNVDGIYTHNNTRGYFVKFPKEAVMYAAITLRREQVLDPMTPLKDIELARKYVVPKPPIKYYCYMRCSTRPQDLNRQKEKLKTWCKENEIDYDQIEIIEEIRTGTNNDRPKFLRLMETLKCTRAKQDVCLILVENTRLGRSYEGNVQMFKDLKEHDIKFVIPGYPLLDTRTKDNYPAPPLINNLVLALYTWIAESERNISIELTNEKRASAQAKGVKFGRKNLTLNDLPSEFIKNYKDFKKVETNETKFTLLARINSALQSNNKSPISRATLYNYIKIYENEKGVDGNELEPIQEPIPLPNLKAKERFQRQNLFRKAFNLFDHKLNLNVTFERKKTIANTGQDLLDF